MQCVPLGCIVIGVTIYRVTSHGVAAVNGDYRGGISREIRKYGNNLRTNTITWAHANTLSHRQCARCWRNTEILTNIFWEMRTDGGWKWTLWGLEEVRFTQSTIVIIISSSTSTSTNIYTTTFTASSVHTIYNCQRDIFFPFRAEKNCGNEKDSRARGKDKLHSTLYSRCRKLSELGVGWGSICTKNV